MSIFYPHYLFHRIYDIPTDFFRKRGITTLLLDIDNTLTTHNNHEIDDRVTAWLALMGGQGIRLMLLSNNNRGRVEPFAQKLGLTCIANAAKPLPIRLRKSLAQMEVQPPQAAIIGDQIFTDILCGRLAGCTAILVEPIQPETHGIFPLKRRLELPILRGYRQQKRKR